ncbi:hypothetical protein FJT64_027742 [Amphibalanus amphitrite]|uniref:Uncharacterized protein n=1 Tax=Amphibalanus amphitrite TaxID=1232801 RepID=A0A6A4VTZ3_AMPAM|nr:hypothetical protein FJT64_027742 [Amphibalanus amphitrite]
MKLVILFALVAVATASYLPYHGSSYYFSQPYYYGSNYYSPYGRPYGGLAIGAGFNNIGFGLVQGVGGYGYGRNFGRLGALAFGGGFNRLGGGYGGCLYGICH